MKPRILWKDIKASFSGISGPGFGISWVPRPDVRRIVEEAVTYIENQGIFYAPHEWEHPKDTYDSAEKVRDKLTEIMQKMPRKEEEYQQLEKIRNALRTFQRTLRKLNLQDTPSKTEMSNEQVFLYDEAINELRYTTGSELAPLAITYELDVYSELGPYLYPPKKG